MARLLYIDGSFLAQLGNFAVERNGIESFSLNEIKISDCMVVGEDFMAVCGDQDAQLF